MAWELIALPANRLEIIPLTQPTSTSRICIGSSRKRSFAVTCEGELSVAIFVFTSGTVL